MLFVPGETRVNMPMMSHLSLERTRCAGSTAREACRLFFDGNNRAKPVVVRVYLGRPVHYFPFMPKKLFSTFFPGICIPFSAASLLFSCSRPPRESTVRGKIRFDCQTSSSNAKIQIESASREPSRLSTCELRNNAIDEGETNEAK
jgi:hypothetical protein